MFCFANEMEIVFEEIISLPPLFEAMTTILDSPYYVFVALCIVVVVVSLIKIAASNENIECFREYFAVGYRAPDPSFFLKLLHGSG